MNDPQRIQQRLQTIGQRDGRSGIGQQEGTGDQHQDPQGHENGPEQTLLGDLQTPNQVHKHRITAGKEQVQYRSKQQNHHQRLHAGEQRLQRNPGNGNAQHQKQEHHTVRDPGGCQEQRNDVHNQHYQLSAGIQLVDQRMAGKKLAQSNVFKHGHGLLSKKSAQTQPAPWYTPRAHPIPFPADP